MIMYSYAKEIIMLGTTRNIKALLFLICLLILMSCRQETAINQEIVLNTGIDKLPSIIVGKGDTLQTGLPIKLKGVEMKFYADSIKEFKLRGKPKVFNFNKKIKAREPEKVFLSNSEPVITPGENNIPLPLDTVLIEKRVLAVTPQPVKAKTPLYRDNAVLDIKWINVEQGLNSSFVLFSYEDSRNNIWIGTFGGGVSRFDGVEFLHYKEKQGQVNNYVWTIFEDDNQNIWFGTYGGGVSKYDGMTFSNYSEENGFLNDIVSCIVKDSKGNVWFGTNKGVVKYDGVVFTNYTKENGLIGEAVISIEEDSKGNMWFGTLNSGLSKYDGKSFISYTKKDGLPDNRIIFLFKDSKEKLWIGTNQGGVCKLDENVLSIYTKKEGLAENKVMCIKEDVEGNMWFATYGGGMSKYDGKSFYNITKEDGLPHNEIRNLLFDSENNIWGATEGAGIFKFNPNSFVSYTDNHDLSFEHIFSIYKDKEENLWFGTDNFGLLKYDGENFMQYSNFSGLQDIGTINDIIEDREGNIWFGTFNNGVFMFNGEILRQYEESSGLGDNTVWSIIEDKNGDLWFGTEKNGVNRFDGKRFVTYNISNGFSSDKVTKIIEDRDRNLWIATNGGGVCEYDFNDFIFFTEKQGLADNVVWTIHEDKERNLWFGTQSGLNRFNRKAFVSYTDADGLSNNIINSIEEDKNGNVWVATPNGLNCIINKDDEKISISKFSKEDGLKSVNFYANSSKLDSRGNIWFGNTSSLSKLNLNTFNTSPNVTALQLNTIEINENIINYNLLHNDEYNKSSNFLNTIKKYVSGYEKFHNYPETLNLPYNFNHLNFKFSAIDWGATHNIKYSYKVDGLDDNWSLPNNENKADYRNIPPGKYTFKVKASGKYGEWSAPLQYAFSISPPWWLSFWAICSYIVLSVLLIIGSFKWYAYRMKKKQLALEKIVEERTQTLFQKTKELSVAYESLEKERNKMELKALLNQINPHFIFNALNSIQQFVISNNVKTSLDYFNKFGKLIRASLEHSEMKFVSIHDEIQVIYNYIDLENLRFSEPVIMNINTNDIDVYNVKIPPMFIQPIVENAIIHGLSKKETDKKIHIEFEEFEDFILCSIQDNGLGRKHKKSKKNKNSGLVITQKRLKSVWNTSNEKGIEIDVEDLKEPTGTIVKIKLPKDF